MLLVKNGVLIDPDQQIEGDFDLVIENGLVLDVQRRGQVQDGSFERVIDAEGKWIFPGLIDLHVHLRDPGLEWKETVETGSRAAIVGGFTSICCMPNTLPSNHSAETTEYIVEKAKAAGFARVLPIGAVTIDLAGKEMAPLNELRDAGCVAFSDDGEPIWDAGMMRRALEWCLMLDATISCHEEDKNLSCGGSMNESALQTKMGLSPFPGVAEDVMIARDIELARVTGAKTHICHVSTARGVELVRRAKNDGIPVTAEATPHHMILTEEAVGDYDTYAKMSPPLREEFDRLGVLEGVADGTIDAIASDHAPHEEDVKKVEFSCAAFGILGLQTSLPLLIELVSKDLISRSRAVEAMTSGPAKAFGLEAGTLRKGAPADLVIVDPECRWTFDKESIQSLSFNSPFIGKEMLGVADTVFVGGKIVLENGEIAKGE